jgi:hypothetical protein
VERQGQVMSGRWCNHAYRDQATQHKLSSLPCPDSSQQLCTCRLHTPLPDWDVAERANATERPSRHRGPTADARHVGVWQANAGYMRKVCSLFSACAYSSQGSVS